MRRQQQAHRGKREGTSNNPQPYQIASRRDSMAESRALQAAWPSMQSSSACERHLTCTLISARRSDPRERASFKSICIHKRRGTANNAFACSHSSNIASPHQR